MKLQFWFEFASTYSYPAVMRIDKAAARGVEVEWRPFLLGPLFHAQQGLKDSPFNAVPIKGSYMWRDVERICEKHNLPFKRPGRFPQNGLMAARITPKNVLPTPGTPRRSRLPEFTWRCSRLSYVVGISDIRTTLASALGRS